MPYLIRFMIRHFSLGFALGLTVVGLMIWHDVLNLGRLFDGKDTLGALALFCGLMGLTFGSVQMAVAVMTAEDPGVAPVREPGPAEAARMKEVQDRRAQRPPRRG